MANCTCYGYTSAADGVLATNKVEGVMVIANWIFDRYLAYDSFGEIATGLQKKGVLMPTGKAAQP